MATKYRDVNKVVLMIKKASLVEFRLVSAILFLFPVALLSLQGGSNFLFFILIIISIASLCKSGSAMRCEQWDADATAFGLALASPVLAVLISQIAHAHFSLSPYDGPARFLLALPIYVVLRNTKIQALTTIQYGFPLGTILALLLFLGDKNSFVASRSGSYFLNLIHFGDLALLLGFLSLFCINFERKDRPLILILKVAGFLAGIFLSLRSGSRGGWVAVPVLCFWWIVLNNHKISLFKWLIAVSILVSVIISSYFCIDVVYSRAQEIFSDLYALEHGNKDTSIGVRLQLWKAAIYLFKEHPFFGLGPEGFKTMMLPLSQSGILTPMAAELGRGEVHNDLLARAAELGVIGVLSFLSLFLIPFFIFIRANKSDSRIKKKAAVLGISLVTGFFVFGLTVEIFSLKMTLTFYSLTLTVLLALATSKQIESSNHMEVPAVLNSDSSENK
jgi:O-antigen ligase